MKFLTIATLLFLAVNAGCAKRVRLPHPSDGGAKKDIRVQKEINEQKEKYLEEIENFEIDFKKLEAKAIDKRNKNYNTKDAEEKLGKMKALLKVTELHLLENNFDSLLERDIRDLKALKSEISDLINHALPGDEPIKKEVVVHKYMDQRDEVVALFGEPKETNKRKSGFTPIEFVVRDPTDMLLRAVGISPCLGDMGGGVQVRYEMLTDIEEWDFPEYGITFIFMKLPGSAREFMNRNDLEPTMRDRAILQTCNDQMGGGYELIYAGPRVTDRDMIAEQLFSGQGRTSGMFGMEGLGRIARATQVLKDLTIVSVLFNAKIIELNLIQENLGNQFFNLIKLIDEKSFNLAAEAIIKRKDTQKSYEDFIIHQPKDLKEKIEAISTMIYGWNLNHGVDSKVLDKVARLFPEKREEISLKGTAFKISLEKLRKEREAIDDQLIKSALSNLNKELIFKQGDKISIFFLLNGARYQMQKGASGQMIESPDINLHVAFSRSLSKKLPPSLIEEKDIKIDSFGVRKTRDFERLTSFGIVLNIPPEMNTGTYQIYLEIKDNISAQTTSHTVSWVIIPKETEE